MAPSITIGATIPKVHIEAVQRLFESGATIINIHPIQQDQEIAIDFRRGHGLMAVPARLKLVADHRLKNGQAAGIQ